MPGLIFVQSFIEASESFFNDALSKLKKVYKVPTLKYTENQIIVIYF